MRMTLAWTSLAVFVVACGSAGTSGPSAGNAGPAMGAAATDPAANDSAASANDAGISSDSTTTSGPCTPPPPSNDCAAPLAPGSSRTCTLTIAGKSRELLVYAPPSFDSCKPAALVVDAHGSSETDADQAGLTPFLDWPSGLGSGFRLVADREGFLVVEPQGISNAWDTSDVAFIHAIPDFVAGVASIDRSRVYMTGISNGGGLTYWTGCGGDASFRAYAPVSGYDGSACTLAHPTPIIHFHSPDDKLVSFADGKGAFDAWVAANHCTHGPTAGATYGGPSTAPGDFCLSASSATPPVWSLVPCAASAPVTTCQMWDQCDGGVSATFCTVAPDKDHHYDQTGGHILYVNATNLSLAAVAWDFWKHAP